MRDMRDFGYTAPLADAPTIFQQLAKRQVLTGNIIWLDEDLPAAEVEAFGQIASKYGLTFIYR